MYATAIVVFREVLEASLVVGLVLAASRGLARRGRWVGLGLAAGIAGALVVAACAGAIASALEGVGQEVFNAAVLFAAVAMLGWHNVWMARHGARLSLELRSIAREVTTGVRPLAILAIVVGLAVLREGSEAVLFLYGIAVAQGGHVLSMAIGAVAGVALGASFGVVLYLGLAQMAARNLFRVTSWLITLLAAGLAAQGAGFLVQAGFLPSLVPTLWDTSGALSETSIVGRILQALVGYVDRPSGIQVAFYLATLLGIVVCGRVLGRAPPRARPPGAEAEAGAK